MPALAQGPSFYLFSVPFGFCSRCQLLSPHVCLQFQLLQRSWLSPPFPISPLGLLPLGQALIPRQPALG